VRKIKIKIDRTLTKREKSDKKLEINEKYVIPKNTY